MPFVVVGLNRHLTQNAYLVSIRPKAARPTTARYFGLGDEARGSMPDQEGKARDIVAALLTV